MAGRGLSKRTLALVVSVVLAGVAAVALTSYVRGVEDKAFEGAETVEAFVAKDTIPVGTSGDIAIERALIERSVIPRKVVPVDAISSLEDIRGKIAGATIFRGEPILGPRFILPSQARGILTIPQDRVAISVEVGIPPGVAGFIQPKDHVSIIALLTVPRGGAGAATEARTQFLLQNVEVLAVGRRVVVTADGQAGEQQATDRVLMTLALRPVEAEKLAFAVFQGQLYFTLLPTGGRPASTQGRTAGNAFR